MKINEDTHFVFVITSSDRLEPRFVDDIDFCISILSTKGINEEDITIISDEAPKNIYAYCPSLSGISVIDSSGIYTFIEELSKENLFFVVSCHGDSHKYGIDASNVIRPHNITESFRKNKNLKHIVALFGQCFAGLFNHMNIAESIVNKKVVYIGVTEIRTGISTMMKANINGKNKEWLANIAVVKMFEWLSRPIDIDNDGHTSIMDMYKYISLHTNTITELLEKSSNSILIDAKLSLEKLKGDGIIEATEKDALTAKANMLINKYAVPHQNCWILNALPAIDMYIE